jgi:hypothetical protein
LGVVSGVVGPTGPQGIQGPTGPQGATGIYSGINLSSTGSGTSIISSAVDPNFYLRSITAGANITITNNGSDVMISGSGSWGSGIGYSFEPQNMGSGGQKTYTVGLAYYKSELAPCSFTTSYIQYWKLLDTSTTITFALFSGTGTFLSSTIPHTVGTGIFGLQTLNWNPPVSFNLNDKFWLGHSTLLGVIYNTVILGMDVNIGSLTGNPKTLTSLFGVTTNSWPTGTGISGITGPVAPTSITGPLGQGANIYWYRLL